MPKNKKNGRALARSRPGVSRGLQSRPARRLTNQDTVFGASPIRGNTMDMNAVMNRMHGVERLCEISCYDSQFGQVSLDTIGFVSCTRLLAMMRRYEMWFVHSMRFKFTPTLSSTAPGTIILAPEWDPIDMPPDLSSTLMGYMGAKTGALNAQLSVEMRNFKMPDGSWCRDSLYTSTISDPRFTSFGKLIWYITGSGLSDENTFGYVDVEWDVSFSIPANEESFAWSQGGTPDAILSFYVDTSSAVGPIAAGGIAVLESTGPDVPRTPTMNAAYALGRIICGVYRDSTDCNLYVGPTNSIAYGTRIFLRLADALYTESAGTLRNLTGTTSYIADMNLSPTFEPSTRVLHATSSTGASVNFDDVYYSGN